MNNLIKPVLTLTLSLLISVCFAQTSSPAGCEILKGGKFRYLDAEDPTAYIIMNGDTQIEYSEKNDFTIESKVKWISDCAYLMKMTKITIPNFPYHPGDTMRVDINKVEGNIIYYTSTVKGVSWKGRFRKVNE